MSGPVRDEQAPPALTIEIKGTDGATWGTILAGAKEFATGSVGFYANGKIVNPKSGKTYQVGANIILVGSKAKKGKS